MNAENMNRSVKKRYITWLLFVLNILCIFMYIFKMYLVSKQNLRSFVPNVQVSFYHGYKFGANDLKATEGVTIFVIDLKSNLLKLYRWF